MRPLRRKLASTFVALGLLGVVVVAVTSYTVVQWRETEQTLSRHYARSLRAQEARALTFEAFKEVPDAVIGQDADAREDYQRRLAPLSEVFEEWAGLAEDDAERQEVATVRAAAQRLDDSAAQVFDLVDAGRRDEAAAQLESVEETAFEPFDALTTAAVQSDREKRRVIRAEADDARRTATLTLAVAGVGVLSLLLLVAAYLTGGVFTPVRKLRDALKAVNDGDRAVRLREDGDDEIAEVNREFNELAASLEEPDAAPVGTSEPRTPVPAGPSQDARLVLARLVGEVREQAELLQRAGPEQRAAASTGLTSAVAALDAGLARLSGLTDPVQLRPSPTRPAVLLHEVLDRFGDEVVRRSISTDVSLAREPDLLVVDRVRLREALAELVRNALDALPERGGHLSLRTSPAERGWAAIEVVDDGAGLSEEDLSWLYDGSRRPQDLRGVGLRLATSIVEQHGGRLLLETEPGGGTTARVLLPAPAGGSAALPTPRPPRHEPPAGPTRAGSP